MRLRALTGCLLLLAIHTAAADRGPSTPEERKQALAIIRRFQDDPLNPNLQSEVQWVVNWTRAVPDVRLGLCASFFKLRNAGSRDGQVLFNAMVFAQTQFILENRDRQDDGIAQLQAGVAGVLHAYEAVLKANSKDRQPFLDALIKHREAGTLEQFVRRHTPSSCAN